MQKNTGNFDRMARIILGLGLISLTVVGPKTLWGLVGLVPLITGSISFCPIYAILGIKTCPLEQK